MVLQKPHFQLAVPFDRKLLQFHLQEDLDALASLGDDDVMEFLFARVGEALYFAGELEMRMLHTVACLEHAHKQDRSAEAEVDFMDVLRSLKQSNLTMGTLQGKLGKHIAFCANSQEWFQKAVKFRNILSHSYIHRRGSLLLDPEKRPEVVQELHEFSRCFEVCAVILQRFSYRTFAIDEKDLSEEAGVLDLVQMGAFEKEIFGDA